MIDRYKFVGVLFAFLLILSMENVVMYNYIIKPDAVINIGLSNHISTRLIAEAYDNNGNLKQRVEKNNDLIMDSFRNFLINWLFTSYNSAGARTVALDDISDTSRTYNVRTNDGGTYANYFVDSSTGTDSKGGYIGIGTGTTAPTVSDYNLESLYGSKVQVTGGYPTWTSASGDITITGTVSITSSVTITEGALFVRWLPSSGSTTYYTMMTRDTFTGIDVVNGDTFVLTIVINLSGEFTDNLGSVLAGIFTYVADGGSVSKTLLPCSGSSNTMYCYYPSNTATIELQRMAPSEQGGSSQVVIGSSSMAISRSMASCQAPLGLRTAPSPTPYISSNAIYIISDILCSEASTIREVGFYSTMAFGSGLGVHYMFLREVISGVAIDAGHSARVMIIITL